ncbi:hypothetical protein BD410DRAFT_732996, partial [Rickenella mellea]
LGRENNKSPFPIEPKAEEIENHFAKDQGGPSAENFRIDFGGTEKSSWNRALASVFADEFLKSEWYNDVPNVTHDHVSKAFSVHLKQLKNQQRALSNDTSNKEKEAAKAAAKAAKEIADQIRVRRGTLFERRRRVCYFYASLHKFIPIIEAMGVEGMSGDEGDHDFGFSGAQRQYAIMNDTPWRNPEAISWLRILDLHQRRTKFRDTGSAAQGNWPRIRYPSNRTFAPGKAVRGLPINVYCPKWLSELSDRQKKDLNLQPATDLQHTDSDLT